MGKGNREDPGDGEAALRAAQLARSAGISINTYAIGPTALQYPRVVTEMARMTVGNYTPVQNPGEFSMLPAAGGYVIPHTDERSKIVTIVVSMMQDGEWDPAYGGGTDVNRPKDITRNFNWMNARPSSTRWR